MEKDPRTILSQWEKCDLILIIQSEYIFSLFGEDLSGRVFELRYN